MRANISRAVEGEWSSIEPVTVGPVPATIGTPLCYVTLVDEEKPLLRVDVYPYSPDSYAFHEAIVWRGNLVVGCGSYVHAISLADRSTVTIALESYFGHLYPTDDYLLLASGERLYRMEPDRSVLWKSDQLGLDGVIVHESEPSVVRGSGDWDPPEGWRPFVLVAADGSRLSIVGAAQPEVAMGDFAELQALLARCLLKLADPSTLVDWAMDWLRTSGDATDLDIVMLAWSSSPGDSLRIAERILRTHSDAAPDLEVVAGKEVVRLRAGYLAKRISVAELDEIFSTFNRVLNSPDWLVMLGRNCEYATDVDNFTRPFEEELEYIATLWARTDTADLFRESYDRAVSNKHSGL